jgi:Fe-S cluster biogenesis protein NfuA
MFIQTESISNPEQMKFIPDRVVLSSGTATFPDAASSERSPLAQRLFEIEGVTGVTLNSDSITLSKSADMDWQVLKSFALNAIMVHFTANEPVVLDDTNTTAPADARNTSWSLSRVKKLWQHARGAEDPVDTNADPEVISTIKELIETRVKPSVIDNGGDVEFRGFEDGVVLLEMTGSASGMRTSIEQLLRHFVPEVTAVTDYRDAMPKPGLETENGIAIRRLLDERINPQVAAHGGHIALVDVADDTVYVRLEGGCQGCGMADVTLKQGVANEIRALVPTITNILDVTDHAGGANPYYQPGKGG